MFNVNDIKRAYDANGAESIAEAVDLLVTQHVSSLERVASSPEEVAADNFNRGSIAALREVSRLLRQLA